MISSYKDPYYPSGITECDKFFFIAHMDMKSARIWWLALLSLNAHLSYEWCGVMKFSTIARWSWEPEEPAKDFDRVGCMFLHPNMLQKFACNFWSSVRSTAPSEKHLRIRKVHTSSMERFVRSISRCGVVFKTLLSWKETFFSAGCSQMLL